MSVALSWCKEHFIKCNDRANLVKSWLPAQYDGPRSWLDQLVYDRALMLVCLVYAQCFMLVSDIRRRVEQRRRKSCSIKQSPRTNAKNYTRNRFGVYTRCKMICCKQEILTWTKTEKRLRHVCPFVLCKFRDAKFLVPRDKTNQATTPAMSNEDGNERS